MIPATGKTKTEIARLLGMSRQHCDIMNEKKPISPEIAVRVAKVVWWLCRELGSNASGARHMAGGAESRR